MSSERKGNLYVDMSKVKDFGRKQEYRKQVTLYMFKGAVTESKSHMEFKSKDAVNV